MIRLVAYSEHDCSLEKQKVNREEEGNNLLACKDKIALIQLMQHLEIHSTHVPSIIVRALPFDVALLFFLDALTTLNIYFFHISKFCCSVATTVRKGHQFGI